MLCWALDPLLLTSLSTGMHRKSLPLTPNSHRQPELLDETSLQRQLLVAALKLPANLTDTERAKVSSVVKLTVQRDAIAPPE